MTEIEMLDAMLTKKRVPHNLHRRFPEMDRDFPDTDWGWQITVTDEKGKYLWDAVTAYGVYMGVYGLLEAIGDELTGGSGMLRGLTAEEVMELWEKRHEK